MNIFLILKWVGLSIMFTIIFAGLILAFTNNDNDGDEFGSEDYKNKMNGR